MAFQTHTKLTRDLCTREGQTNGFRLNTAAGSRVSEHAFWRYILPATASLNPDSVSWGAGA